MSLRFLNELYKLLSAITNLINDSMSNELLSTYMVTVSMLIISFHSFFKSESFCPKTEIGEMLIEKQKTKDTIL